MEVYGLTGGIGSGKSTVASLLEEYGIPVVSADELSRIVVAPGSEGLRQVVEEFGPQMVDESGELDRAKMASLVFRDPERRRRLEEILHPRIRERFEQVLDALEKAGHEVAIYEVPLLFEKNLQGEMKAVILVTAPEHVRVGRVRNRDDVTETEVRARMAAQMDEASKRRRADYVIENDGNLDELRREVEFLIARFLRVGIGPRAPASEEAATPTAIADGDRSYEPYATPAPSRRPTEVPTNGTPSEALVRTGNTLPPGAPSGPLLAAEPPVAASIPGITGTMPAPGSSPTMPAAVPTPAPPAPPAPPPSHVAPAPSHVAPAPSLPPLVGTQPAGDTPDSAATMPLGARLPPPPPTPPPADDDATREAAASRPTVVSVHEPPSAPPLRKPEAAKPEPPRPSAPRPPVPRRTATLAAPTLGAPTPPPPPARPPSPSGRTATPAPPSTARVEKVAPGGTMPPPPPSTAPAGPPPRGRTERYASVSGSDPAAPDGDTDSAEAAEAAEPAEPRGETPARGED